MPLAPRQRRPPVRAGPAGRRLFLRLGATERVRPAARTGAGLQRLLFVNRVRTSDHPLTLATFAHNGQTYHKTPWVRNAGGGGSFGRPGTGVSTKKLTK